MTRRVLIVEDEALLGMELKDIIADAGMQPLGPAPSVRRALQLLSTCDCDAAVLDVNLGSETAEPVAVALEGRGIPFIVLSGYTRDQYPPRLKRAPVLNKPVDAGELVRALQSIIETGRSAKIG